MRFLHQVKRFLKDGTDKVEQSLPVGKDADHLALPAALDASCSEHRHGNHPVVFANLLEGGRLTTGRWYSETSR